MKLKTINLKSLLCMLLLLVGINAWGAIADGTYVLCTSTSDLEVGAHYIIASGNSGSVQCISNVSNANNRKIVAATVANSKIEVGSTSTIMTFTLGGSTGAWTFSTDNYAGTDGYLASAASGSNTNYCRVISTETTGTISFSNKAASIKLSPHGTRNILRYNSSSSCFACYSSGQADVYLYKKEGAADTRTAVNMSTFTTVGDVTSIVKGNTLATSVTNDQSGWTAAYTYESSNESVATVAADGTITAVAKGTAKITAKLNVSASDASYKAGTTTSKSIDITVTNPTHKVYFSTNGSFLKEDGDEYEEGAAITFPAETPADVNGKKFVGWYGSSYSNATTAPTYVTSATMGENDVTYYAVYAYQAGDGVSVESLNQTLKYDTWTYGGSTTDKSSYRLFHNGGYIESASFNLSQLSKVVVYGGTFGGTSYKNLTIGDGTNTWKSVTVSGSSETGTNTYTNGTALTGTSTLKITSGSGTASGSGVRISKVEIYTTTPGYTYSAFETTVSAAVESTVTLNANGGTINAGDVTTYTEGVGATLPTDVTKTGYTFDGWYADEELTGDAVTAIGADATGNKEYWAKWTANTYTIKFNANGGTGEMADQSFTYDEDAKALTANAFTKTGYAFAGWATTADGEKAYDDEAEVKNLTSTDKATVNLYALWSVNSYTLAWSYDDSECEVIEDGTEAGEVEFGTALTAPTLKRKGYSLSWDPEVPATMPADNVTYTAVWTAKYYDVTFDKNADDATGTMEPQSIQFGASATLTANAFVYPGHTFKGWTTSSEGYKDYDDEAEYTMQEEGVTLYAVWEENDKYTLTWSVNGHETTEDVAEGSSISFNDPTENIPEGKVFRGWYADGDYSNATDEPTYVTEATMPDHNITYYAVFATATGSAPQPASTTINSSTKNFPTSYAAAADVTLNGVSFNVTQAYVYGTKLQWRASGNSNGTGAMYNNDALQSIQSIVLTYDGDSYKNFTVNVGSSANPTSGTSITGVVDANNNNVYTYDCSSANADYFVLTNGTNAGYLSSIKINYLSGGGYTYKDFTTTVVVRTLTGIEFGGSLTKDEYTEEETFDPAGITVLASYEGEAEKENITSLVTLTYSTDPLTVGTTSVNVSTSYKGFDINNDYDITVNAIPTYTVTIVAPENGTLTVKNGENTVNSGDALRAGTVLNITATAADGYKFRNLQVVDGSTHTFTASNEKEWELGAINTTIKANFDIINQYQVTWMANGTQLKQETVYENVGSVAPEVTCPTGYTLAGWSTTEANEETTTAPTFATLTEGNFMPEAATTLYAVYTRSEGGQKVYTINKDVKDFPTTYDAAGDLVVNGFTFNLDDIANFASNMQFKKSTGMIVNESELPMAINSVVVTYSSSTSYKNLTLYIGDEAQTTENEITPSVSENVYTFDCSASSHKFFSLTVNSNNACNVDEVVITCGNSVGTTYYTTMYSTQLNISAAMYATFYDSKHAYIMPDDCEGFVFTAANGLESAYEGGDVVPAGEPLVIYSIEEGKKTLNFTTSTEPTFKPGEMNDLNGTDEATDITPDDNYYFYGLSAAGSKGIGFYWMADNGAAFKNGAHKAYLKVAKTAGAPVMSFPFKDNTTAISNAQSSNSQDAVIYNLAGQRVNGLQKGIYIVNGKKVLKK